MKLRWFQTYNRNGLNSEKELQYWDSECGQWIEVGFVRVREDSNVDYLTDEKMDGRF